MSNPRIKRALEFLDGGNPQEAKKILKVLALKKPVDIEVLYLIGVAEFGLNEFASANDSFGRVLARNPSHTGAISSMARLLISLGKHQEAMPYLDRAIGLAPGNYWAYMIRGSSNAALRRFDAALSDFDRALDLNPKLAEAYSSKGNVLRELKREEDSLDCFLRAIELKPGYAEAWSNRGVVLAELGRHEEALASYDQAIHFMPDHVEVWVNRGNVLSALDRHEEARAGYQKATELRPDHAEAWLRRGVVSAYLERYGEALMCYHNCIALKPDDPLCKKLYAECVSEMSFESLNPAIHLGVVTALNEAWIRPSSLSKVACNLLLLNPAVSRFHGDADGAGARFDPAGEGKRLDALGQLGRDPLLRALLASAPVSDDQLERILAEARSFLLHIAAKANDPERNHDSALPFFSALAQQCFINEYVFSCADEELQAAGRIRDLLARALESGEDIPPLWLVAVACYFPLCAVARAETLLERSWPDEVSSLLTQQIREPFEERRLRPSIPLLTPIDDDVSMAVQSQYEENPYPRWIKMPREGEPKPLAAFLRERFPGAKIVQIENDQHPDILIAGCGTGQHPITTAQLFQGANLLAVDLSAASLSYAKRKTREMDIRTIEYAQADILKLGSLGRTFDVIESSGVLHHLENPLEGWKLLVSLLRRNGLMHLGFYSEMARRHVVKARNLIKQKGFGATSREIRAARDMLRELDRVDFLGCAVRLHDFYSLSGCRDLLFHVQEHQLNLEVIREFIRKNGLAFLGFDIGPSVTRAYRLRFPDDPAATNLENWQIFERENPDTFVGMYQFWLQKQ